MPKRDPTKPRPAKVIKGKRPRPDLSLIPALTGESKMINFRADAVTLADMEEHLERLEARAPYVAITLSDALRSLIQEGARSFRERLPEHQPDEEEK
jgi:hypothetical protein